MQALMIACVLFGHPWEPTTPSKLQQKSLDSVRGWMDSIKGTDLYDRTALVYGNIGNLHYNEKLNWVEIRSLIDTYGAEPIAALAKHGPELTFVDRNGREITMRRIWFILTVKTPKLAPNKVYILELERYGKIYSVPP
jgi:hypothetical protein